MPFDILYDYHFFEKISGTEFESVSVEHTPTIELVHLPRRHFTNFGYSYSVKCQEKLIEIKDNEPGLSADAFKKTMDEQDEAEAEDGDLVIGKLEKFIPLGPPRPVATVAETHGIEDIEMDILRSATKDKKETTFRKVLEFAKFTNDIVTRMEGPKKMSEIMAANEKQDAADAKQGDADAFLQ